MLRTSQSHLIACVLAAAVALPVASNANAGDLGCDACDAYPGFESESNFHKPGCIRLGSGKGGCLGKLFESISNCFERMLLCKCGCGTFGKCGSGSVCDDGCDAAMMDELMVPAPIHYDRPGYSPVQPVPARPIPAPRVVAPTRPNNSYRAVQPTPAPTPTPALGDESEGISRSGRPLAPTRIPVPAPEPPKPTPTPPTEVETPPKRGSLFDSLNDPFRDDQSRKRVYRSVRPTSFEELSLRPVVRRVPLPRPQSTAPRPDSNAR